MKILIVTETLYDGGSELFCLRLARGLIKKGIEARVLSLNRSYENREMTGEYKDVPIMRLSLPFLGFFELVDKVLRKLKIDFSFKYFFQGRQVVKACKGYDVVHSHYIQVDYLLAKLEGTISARHVVTVHGDYSAQYDSFQKGTLNIWLHLDKKLDVLQQNVNHWVVISDEQRAFFRNIMKIPDDKISKIYNGFELLENTGPSLKNSNVFTIGMVSRGHENKGWQLLIDAFLKLPGDTQLILVGGSEYMDLLKRKYESERRIVFAGFQANTGKWLAQIDLFVLPTLFPFESLPTVIIEALSHGLPVIATRVGEVEKMLATEVEGEIAGSLLDPEKGELTASAIAEKIKYFYENREQLRLSSMNALVAFRKFSMDTCLASYMKIYREITSVSD